MTSNIKFFLGRNNCFNINTNINIEINITSSPSIVKISMRNMTLNLISSYDRLISIQKKFKTRKNPLKKRPPLIKQGGSIIMLDFYVISFVDTVGYIKKVK